MHKYTDEQKKTVLDLFNQGYSKNEIAKKTGLPYYFVVIFTPKTQNRHYLSDKAVVILKQLNEKGYYFPKGTSECNTIRGLKELVSIHFARFRGKRIAYTTGHENEAIKKFIEHYHLNYLNDHELAAIRNVSGLKEKKDTSTNHTRSEKPTKKREMGDWISLKYINKCRLYTPYGV